MQPPSYFSDSSLPNYGFLTVVVIVAVVAVAAIGLLVFFKKRNR
jgi:hypothetical protein